MKKVFLGLFCSIGVISTIFYIGALIFAPVAQYQIFHNDNDW